MHAIALSGSLGARITSPIRPRKQRSRSGHPVWAVHGVAASGAVLMVDALVMGIVRYPGGPQRARRCAEQLGVERLGMEVTGAEVTGAAGMSALQPQPQQSALQVAMGTTTTAAITTPTATGPARTSINIEARRSLRDGGSSR